MEPLQFLIAKLHKAMLKQFCKEHDKIVTNLGSNFNFGFRIAFEKGRVHHCSTEGRHTQTFVNSGFLKG